MNLSTAINCLFINPEKYAEQQTNTQNFILALTMEADNFTLLQLEYTPKVGFECFLSSASLIDPIDEQDSFVANSPRNFFKSIPDKFKKLNFSHYELESSPLDFIPLAFLPMIFPNKFQAFKNFQDMSLIEEKKLINQARILINDLNKANM